MRIGIDIRTTDPEEPGQQRYLWRLGAWLGEKGHEVHFLTVRPQQPETESPSGATLHRLDGITRATLRRAVSLLSLDILLLNPERSRRYRGIPANVLRPAYGTEHYLQKLRSFRNPVELALRRALRSSPWVLAERRWERAFYEDRTPSPEVIAQSEYMRGHIVASYRVPEAHVHVVHNGVDTDEYSPSRRRALRAEMRERWAIPDDAFCLLFLGHNFRLKGLWRILDILPRLGGGTPFHLLAVGRGTGPVQRGRAWSLIRRRALSDRVTMTGPVRPSVNALAAADALLHLSWHDSFGFVALEAMASGLPVVTTRHTGASEIIDEGTSGLLVDPGDHTAIIESIRRLSDPELRARIGAAAAEAGSGRNESANFQQVLRVLAAAHARNEGPIEV